MKKAGLLILLALSFLWLAACGADHDVERQSSMEKESPSASLAASETEETLPESETQQESEIETREDEPVRIQIAVGDTLLIATPENNPSADAFLALLRENPITVEMSDYAGTEKVGSLGTSLTRSDSQIRVGAGDVILYQGDQITIYYGTNSWNFTKLAHIDAQQKKACWKCLAPEM